MDYFWKENKKFLIAAGAALLGALLYYGFVIGPIRDKADRAGRKLQTDMKNLQARRERGEADEDTIGLAKIELKRTQDMLTSLAGDMSFKEGDRYRKPDGQSWTEHYNAEKLEVLNKLKELARNLQKFPPDIGGLREAEENLTDDLARELLLRLAVVEHLVKIAVEAKVDRIDVLDAVPAAHAGARRDDVVTRKGAFLNKYTVHMTFKGEQKAIFRVLHGVQKKGTYLAVSHFDVSRTDQTRDYLDAQMRVSLLRIDEKAPIEVKEERNP